MTRSLLDGADLAAIRVAGGRGRSAMVLACLVDGGVVQQDPDDPSWADRDRLVVAAPKLVAPTAEAFRRSPDHPDRGWIDGGPPGRGLALAYGTAAGSQLDGGIFRTYVLVEDAVVDDGAAWEALRAAGLARAATLTLAAVLAPAAATLLGALLEAAGWAAAWVDAHDPAQVLGGFDQARGRADQPTAVVAVSA